MRCIVFSSNWSIPHVLILSWFLIIFSQVRIAALFFLPPIFIEFSITSDLTDMEISKCMTLYLGGLFAILFGIYSADRLINIRQKSLNIATNNFSIGAISCYWLVTNLVSYYVHIYLGVTIFASPEHWGNRMAWVAIIFDTVIALLITIGWVVISLNKKSLTKNKIIFACILISI